MKENQSVEVFSFIIELEFKVIQSFLILAFSIQIKHLQDEFKVKVTSPLPNTTLVF